MLNLPTDIGLMLLAFGASVFLSTNVGLSSPAFGACCSCCFCTNGVYVRWIPAWYRDLVVVTVVVCFTLVLCVSFFIRRFFAWWIGVSGVCLTENR
jgi:hypothetical protein